MPRSATAASARRIPCAGRGESSDEATAWTCVHLRPGSGLPSGERRSLADDSRNRRGRAARASPPGRSDEGPPHRWHARAVPEPLRRPPGARARRHRGGRHSRPAAQPPVAAGRGRCQPRRLRLRPRRGVVPQRSLRGLQRPARGGGRACWRSSRWRAGDARPRAGSCGRWWSSRPTTCWPGAAAHLADAPGVEQGGRLLARQGPAPVACAGPASCAATGSGAAPTTRTPCASASAWRRPRCPTGSPWWATAPTASPAFHAGARARPARCWRTTGTSRPSPTTPARWKVQVRAPTRSPRACGADRADAALYRVLATLRTDVPHGARLRTCAGARRAARRARGAARGDRGLDAPRAGAAVAPRHAGARGRGSPRAEAVSRNYYASNYGESALPIRARTQVMHRLFA